MNEAESIADEREPCARAAAKVARLRQQLARERRLLATLRRRGPRPRGLVVGLLIGAIVSAAGVGALVHLIDASLPAERTTGVPA